MFSVGTESADPFPTKVVGDEGNVLGGVSGVDVSVGEGGGGEGGVTREGVATGKIISGDSFASGIFLRGWIFARTGAIPPPKGLVFRGFSFGRTGSSFLSSSDFFCGMREASPLPKPCGIGCVPKDIYLEFSTV